MELNTGEKVMIEGNVPALDGNLTPPLDEPTLAWQTPPWQEIAAGRYQPRRIRGSCRGRELG